MQGRVPLAQYPMHFDQKENRPVESEAARDGSIPQIARSLPDDTWHAALGRLYDVALDPLHYETLIDVWEDAVGPMRKRADAFNTTLLNDPEIAEHFRRAGEVLDRVMPENIEEEITRILRPFGRVPAFAIDGRMRIRAVNTVARVQLGAVDGGILTDLPILGTEIASIRNAVAGLAAEQDHTAAIMRVRTGEDGRFLILRLQRFLMADQSPIVVVAANDLKFPAQGQAVLRDAFALTQAEAEVLHALVDCGSLTEIATKRGRSLDTIRSQIKTIMSKTETRSQVELVRLALSVVEISQVSPPDAATESKGRSVKKLTSFASKTLTTPEGRRIDYFVLGDPMGRPILYSHMALAMPRWPASAEAFARRRGLRIIVPIYPGYGHTTPAPRKSDYDAVLLSDARRVLLAENVTRCPYVGVAGGAYFAFRFAHENPELISGILCGGGMLPDLDHTTYDGMGKWHRFIVGGAKYTPHLLSFMVKTGFALTRRIGKIGFLNAIYSGSEADKETYSDPDVLEALLIGSEVGLSEGISAHDSYVRSMIGGMLRDWSALIAPVTARIPVIFFNGLQDPQVPPAAIEQMLRNHPQIDFRVYPDAGQLILFRHWQDALEVLNDLTRA